MARDWINWHKDYEQDGSSLARRLAVVQGYIGQALTLLQAQDSRSPLRIISMCAGDGRDLLPVLAQSPQGLAAQVRLVELDSTLVDAARRRANSLALSGVEVHRRDAGLVAAYTGATPADLVLVCGVLGNIDAPDAQRTLSAVRAMTTPGGIVIWTRGRDGGHEPSHLVRHWLSQEGFREMAFTAPQDAGFRVGMHRLPLAAPAVLSPPSPRLFTFVDNPHWLSAKRTH